MKRMIAIKMTLAMFFFFFASLISSQSTKIPENFVEAEIPIVESSDWFKLSHSLDYFAVKKVNNELVIEKTDFKEKIEFSTKNAKLVGYDQGEFGGRLDYIPNVNPSKITQIMFGNIVDIFRFKSKIYILQGGYKGGSLSELKIDKEKFYVKKLVNFHTPPLAAEACDERIFVVSFNGFYIVENNDFEKVFYNQFGKAYIQAQLRISMMRIFS